MTSLTRQIAICGLIALGLIAIGVSAYVQDASYAAIANTVVVGIVSVLRRSNEPDEVEPPTTA